MVVLVRFPAVRDRISVSTTSVKPNSAQHSSSLVSVVPRPVVRTAGSATLEEAGLRLTSARIAARVVRRVMALMMPRVALAAPALLQGIRSVVALAAKHVLAGQVRARAAQAALATLASAAGARARSALVPSCNKAPAARG